MAKHIDAATRFWSKVRIAGPDECWEWLAYRLPKGYGHFSIGKQKILAHRWSYEAARGPIPDGLHIDHLCKNTSCVNPRHLEAVTPAENNRRSNSLSAQRARQRVCKRGHPLSGANLKVSRKGQRSCRICVNASWREMYHRRRATV